MFEHFQNGNALDSGRWSMRLGIIKFLRRMRCLLQDNQGGTAVENTLIIIVIFVVIVGFTKLSGDNLRESYNNLSNKMSQNN